VDLRKIKKLIELVEESGIAELEVKSGEEAVRISMPGAQSVPPTVATILPAGPQVLAAPDLPDAGAMAAAAEQAAPMAPAGKPLNSPLSGTFYVAPSPEAEPFVQVGARVAAGDVLCIVESMKMMNRIEADRSATVVAVLASNGEPVESGQPLFLLQD